MDEYKTGEHVFMQGRAAIVVGRANKKCYHVREQAWGPDVEPATVHKDWLTPAAKAPQAQ